MYQSEKSDVKGETKNSVKAGRLCHPLYRLIKSGKEVVVMKKYILRIIFFAIVFLIAFTIKVK